MMLANSSSFLSIDGSFNLQYSDLPYLSILYSIGAFLFLKIGGFYFLVIFGNFSIFPKKSDFQIHFFIFSSRVDSNRIGGLFGPIRCTTTGNTRIYPIYLNFMRKKQN